MAPDLLTYQQTAPRLGISVCTLQRLKAKKRILYVEMGRKVYFTEQIIEDYINSRTHGGMGARSRRPSYSARS